MLRFSLAFSVVLLSLAPAFAGPFGGGIGSAWLYGPYTGGHGYSYNTAYSYGFSFSSADTWRRDPFAYPAGIAPYRPFGRPISRTVFPTPATPFISVPGPDGLPTLVRPSVPSAGAGEELVAPTVSRSAPLETVPTAPVLRSVPAAGRPAASEVASTSGRIRVKVPYPAEVFVEKELLPTNGTHERVWQTPALPAGKMQIYSLRARWREDGVEIDRYRVIGVYPGETAVLDFFAK
jgi:uncharacterized protein (TIGR03000 family)